MDVLQQAFHFHTQMRKSRGTREGGTICLHMVDGFVCPYIELFSHIIAHQRSNHYNNKGPAHRAQSMSDKQ